MIDSVHQKLTKTRRHHNIRYAGWWWSRDGFLLGIDEGRLNTQQIELEPSPSARRYWQMIYLGQSISIFIATSRQIPRISQSMNCLQNTIHKSNKKGEKSVMTNFPLSEVRIGRVGRSQAAPSRKNYFIVLLKQTEHSRKNSATRMSNFLRHFKISKLWGQIHLTSQWECNLKGAFALFCNDLENFCWCHQFWTKLFQIRCNKHFFKFSQFKWKLVDA